MERATNDTGWMMSATGELLGLTLGFDFCAQHEMGTQRLRAAFGVTRELAVGLADRKVRRLPSELSFEAFERKPRDKRRKSVPCAVLTNDPRAIPFIKRGEMLEFWSDIGGRTSISRAPSPAKSSPSSCEAKRTSPASKSSTPPFYAWTCSSAR